MPVFFDQEYISIHTLRMEGDEIHKLYKIFCIISIHTLRMEGDKGDSAEPKSIDISIHTLRMEGDGNEYRLFRSLHDFNPHPPHGG